MDGNHGPVIAGVSTVSAKSAFTIPSGTSGEKFGNDGENIVKNGLITYLDAKYSYDITDPYVWYDMSGTGKNAEISRTGVDFINSYGGYLQFDGANGAFNSRGDIAPYQLPENPSYSAWFRTSTAAPSTENIIDFGTHTTMGAGANNQGGMALTWRSSPASNGRLSVSYRDTRFVTSSYPFVTGTTNVRDGLWHHAHVTFSFEKGPIIYVDGVDDNASHDGGSSSGNLYSSTIGNASLWTLERFHFTIARLANQPTDYRSDIDIAQVLIYDRELSATEVAQNYNTTKSRFGH